MDIVFTYYNCYIVLLYVKAMEFINLHFFIF